MVGKYRTVRVVAHNRGGPVGRAAVGVQVGGDGHVAGAGDLGDFVICWCQEVAEYENIYTTQTFGKAVRNTMQPSVPSTVTTNEHLLLLPAASVAVYLNCKSKIETFNWA